MMALARSLGVPVPKVLKYNCTRENPIGWPFIAFEEPDGSEINIWTDLNDDERLKLADEVADIEARFLSFELLGFGAIYFSRDLPVGCPSFPIPNRGDLKGLCVGPFCTRMWRFHGHEPQGGGPFINPEAFTFNDISKNIQGVPEDGPIVHGEKKHDFKLQHRKLYDDYLKIVDHLLPRIITAISTPRLSAYDILRSHLRHVNFTQSRNVKIAAITDEFSGMAEPGLLAWGTNLMRRSRLRSSKPRMPRQPETISHKRQELIAKQLVDWRQAMMEARFFDKIKHIEESHSILSIPNWHLLRELLIAVKSHHSADPIHLHAALINVTENWDDITKTKDGHAPPCPISYSEEEKNRVLREQERNDASVEELSFISKIIETNASERVASAENYTRVRDYFWSINARIEANDGKYYPDVDESDSTEEAFETPDEFETVLCKRMGISRATFWRSVADTAVWKKNNFLNEREGYFEEKSRVGRSEWLREQEQQGFEKEEEKEKKKHFDSISHFISMMK
ncbi:hypothetical protein BFW01_g10134 [Lasiodiplodia theobromae]|uniref:Aminoglycoside phosphotransferase domain-containing protein n=1 Tax=Lasiodiplodia theobromae TaxID=45133 RepID=A0A8H7INL9_9PEZI|nr:hypothetical protein BFW01_g10134 [Lasiodiplodia theobromae]